MNDPGAREFIDEGVAEAEGLGDEGAILQGHLARTIWHYHQGRFADAAVLAEEGHRLLIGASDQTTRADFLWIQAMVLPFLGRLEQATTAIREAREVGQQRNEVGAALNAAFGELAATAMRTGDGSAVEALGRELAEEFREASQWASAGLFYAGMGKLWKGDIDGAAELMNLDSDSVREPRLYSALSGAWRFRTAAYAGRPKAMALYEAVAPRLLRVGRRAFPGDAFGLHAAIEGLAVLEEIGTAASHYPDALEAMTRGTAGHFDGLLLCSAGIAAACAERWDAVEEHFAAATRLSETIPHVMAQCDTRRWHAWALLRRPGQGDSERARGLLEHAIDGYGRLGAGFFGQVATDLLTRMGS